MWAGDGEFKLFLPFISSEAAPMVEFRGLWVTRFEWTQDATPAKIEEIVNNAAYAGFNVLLFQVRGEADALYASELEPWSRLLTGTLGQEPGWDPLAYMIEKAHERNLQVHAYINVYPLWLGCTPPPADTTPQHLYHQLVQAHGLTENKANGVQWTTAYEVDCGSYLRATPASDFANEQHLAVAADLVTRYAVDGLHLDHMRYADTATSCDPVSELAYGGACFGEGYGDWQRAQVTETLYRFYSEVVPLRENLWLSAAVWPIHTIKAEWNWPIVKQGYGDYYQDSKGWLQAGLLHSISPMIYPAQTNCPDNSFWSLARWQILTADFQAEADGRYIIPGIGTSYCDFAEIEARIELARSLGTVGHALFSYSSLLANGYFDDLAEGVYGETAVVPPLPTLP